MSGALLCVCLAMTAQDLPQATIARGTLSGVEERREAVVRTPAEWNALWKQHAPGSEAPVVDLSAHTVIAVFLGMRSSAGYEVTITSVARDGEGVVVRYRATSPSPATMTAQMLTFPFHIVSVPRFDGGARFERVDDGAR